MIKFNVLKELFAVTLSNSWTNKSGTQMRIAQVIETLPKDWGLMSLPYLTKEFSHSALVGNNSLYLIWATNNNIPVPPLTSNKGRLSRKTPINN